jgi:hypothetical protein
MVRLLIVALLLLSQFSCAPLERPVKVAECSSYPSRRQLLSGNWLQQPATWQLRQSALLEIRGRKFPLLGLLRLDTARREARLVAMNELGLVVFDLQLDEQGQQLHRALPQLQQQENFVAGVADSLRRIFFAPAPSSDDRLQQRPATQRLRRPLSGGSLGSVFDCSGDLQEVRQLADTGDWRVTYHDYKQFSDQRIPQQILYNDFRHGVRLSLWLTEVKQKK